MGEPERDRYSGHMTTGHEWNGIKELNTPVPRMLYGFLGAAFLFSLGYWLLMPAFPTRDGYTEGLLGADQQERIRTQLAAANDAKAAWQRRMIDTEFDTIRADERLMSIVDESGPALYRDNCAMCHGGEGDGERYFPRLNDAAWMWGDDPESILKTLQVGINSSHPESRIGIMPAFGRDGTLSSEQIEHVVLYLRSRSNPVIGSGQRASELLATNAGAEVYTRYCVACHGSELGGNPTLGAPDLADDFWLYGGDEPSLTATITNGRAGYMPAWESRLSLTDRKILTLYVLSLHDRYGKDSPPDIAMSGAEAP